MEACEVPRWQILKQQLRNLNYPSFVEEINRDSNNICLDVRTPEEFPIESFPGALNINYLSDHLADDLEKLPKDKHYYVYCRTGRRSLRVCVLLQNIGYTVTNLDGGIKEYM